MQTKSAPCELLGVNGILLLVVLRLSYKKIANPINDPWMSYDLTDNLDMNLVPREKAEGSGEYLIAEYYHAKRLQSLLKVDFFKGLMVGHQIRRCLNCNRFFIVNGGYKTKYCDMPSPENPNRTCNQMDFAKKKPKEKNAEKRTLLAKSEKLYHSAMTSPEFTNDEFEQQLSSASLYRLCGMEPPRKGRSGQADDRRTCKQGKDITRYEYSDWLKNLHVAKSEFSVSLRLKYLTFSDILVIY